MNRMLILALLLWTSACVPINQSAPTLASTPFPSPPVTFTPFQPSAYLTPTPGYPEAGYGPTDFPAHINPLTGLSTDPALLDRRPMIVKVSNLPRIVRPQFGLSKADVVFEYYTEEGTTRFAAIFYSQDAEQVGSIRSARFFDEHLVNMYRGLFIFGSGDERVRDRLYKAGFADRLILEWQAECPALCRPDPVTNYLIGNTSAIREYAEGAGISDERQNLVGMRYQMQTPIDGQAVPQIFTWYSAVIYNRWDYVDGRYVRFADVKNAFNDEPEMYARLTDALTGEAVQADNVIILLMPHTFYSESPEMVEMQFGGSGPAYTFRDGQAYEIEWQRVNEVGLFSLVNKDGSPFPLKPGVTWFEVMGLETKIDQRQGFWRFEMRFP